MRIFKTFFVAVSLLSEVTRRQSETEDIRLLIRMAYTYGGTKSGTTVTQPASRAPRQPAAPRLQQLAAVFQCLPWLQSGVQCLSLTARRPALWLPGGADSLAGWMEFEFSLLLEPIFLRIVLS